ncbi:MAG: hypothetical protein AAGC57_07025 [Pseudomonadota bacterium]
MQTTLEKEVTPDEYRSAQSANQQDVGMWLKGQPLAIHLGNAQYWVPPFDGDFHPRTGMLWSEWTDTNGASGAEPLAWVPEMNTVVKEFQSSAIRSDTQAESGAKLAGTMVDQMLVLGAVQAPGPVDVHNTPNNVLDFKTWSYEPALPFC